MPDVGLFATVAKLEPPTRDEGFDELFVVQLSDDKGFIVAAVDQDVRRGQ